MFRGCEMMKYLFFLAVVIAYPSYADNSEFEKEVLEQASNEVKIATDRFDAMSIKCKEIAKNRKIDVSLFKDILFDDLKFSLLHLSRKAFDQCLINETKNYSYSLSKAKGVYEHYGITPPDEVNVLDVIHFSDWQNMEIEAKHKKIPAQYRVVLDAMDALKTPFEVTVLVDRIDKKYNQN